VKKENINIGVDEGRLTITAEKVKQIDETTDQVRRLERRFGQFNRQFTLPEGIEADKIQADYEDGVLHIHIPKAEKGKAKTIKIGEGGGVLKRLINNRHVKEHTRAAND
jgi:HSP20 family protein